MNHACLDNKPNRETLVNKPYTLYLDILKQNLKEKHLSIKYPTEKTFVNEPDTRLYQSNNCSWNLFFFILQRSLVEVQTSIDAVRFHQSESRMHVVRDWYLATGNNNHIMYWSIFQIGVILVTSFFQVFCLRRLFRTTAVTPTSKPRA